MSNTVLSIQTHRDNNKNRHQGGAARGGVDLKAVLNDAFSKTGAKGSSTACVVALDGAALHAVNVRDSGFVHVRGGKIIYRSKAQQHRFNCPYQLRKGNGGMDLAEEIKRDVENGDVIVAGTDGLFDNVHEEELEKLVRDGVEHSESPESLAWKIAGFAYRQSQDSNIVSPFAVQSYKAGIAGHGGGKRDDITVLVAYMH